MPQQTPPAGSREIRRLRLLLQLSQPTFARLLGVSTETYRAWDSGRRAVSDAWLDQARALAAAEDPGRLWSLQALATELGVHVRTLRDAARRGRLDVTYENRVVFRNPIPRATIAAGRAFMARYYKQSYSRFAVKPPVPAQTQFHQNARSNRDGLLCCPIGHCCTSPAAHMPRATRPRHDTHPLVMCHSPRRATGHRSPSRPPPPTCHVTSRRSWQGVDAAHPGVWPGSR